MGGYKKTNRPTLTTQQQTTHHSNPRAGHQQGGHDSGSREKRAADTLELLAEMTVLARADVLVGSQSSNVAKLALALRGAEGWGLRTSWSVDGVAVGEAWELP